MSHQPGKLVISVAMAGLLSAGLAGIAQEWKSGVDWQEPPTITPGEGTAPPSDAIVLFDGTNLDAWNGGEGWKLQDGYGVVGSEITSKRGFGDCQFHLEFATPEVVEGEGQGRGNSGLFLMDRYELQILDSYGNTTYFDGQCGAFYKQRPPMVNCCRPPGEWQTYDVYFTAPRFHTDGSLKTPAYVTVVQNGVLIHNHYELLGPTPFTAPPRYVAHTLREPVRLQHHGNPVRFRNIWIRDLMTDAASADQTAAADAG